MIKPRRIREMGHRTREVEPKFYGADHLEEIGVGRRII
jgi:hypothetical protein